MNKELLRQFLVDSNKAGYAGGRKRNGSKNRTAQQRFLLKKAISERMIIFLAVNHMGAELLSFIKKNLFGSWFIMDGLRKELRLILYTLF